MQTSYKNYFLSSESYQLHDNKKWKVAVMIAKTKNDPATVQTFETNNTFDTEEEANVHAIQYGKEIIDGAHVNITLSF